MATSEPVLEVDRSESFTNGLLFNLWDMKTRGESTDMTIIATNVPIQCHSVVMAAASEHFRELLNGPMKDATTMELELNFDEVYVQKIIQYCYTGKIIIALSTAKSYLRIADYFQLTELKATIEKFVCEHVSLETCVGWYFSAKEFKMRTLENNLKVTISANLGKLTEGVEFHEMSASELKECIKFVENADAALEACVNWVSSNALSRGKVFLDLLTQIQLDKCSPQCVEKVMRTWKPIWPNYAEVQKALKPFASVVPKDIAKPKRLTMLLLGGHTQDYVLNMSMWKIDLKAGTCELSGTMDHRAVKYCPGYCCTPEKLFVIGGSMALGEGKYKPLSDCHAPSVQDLQCEAWPDVDEPLAEMAAVCVNDHIYTFGGGPNGKAVYRLNLKTKKWSRCPDMPVRNSYPIIAAIRHTVYWIFNTSTYKYVRTSTYNEKFQTSYRVVMYCFDTSTQTWTSLMPLPASIPDTCHAMAVSVGEDIYLVGGLKRLCARYSPQQKTWKLLKRPQVVHQVLSAVHMDGEIVLCGGTNENDEPHDIIEVYNIAQDTWRVHSVRMPVGLDNHHCAVYDEEAHRIVL